MTTTTNEAEATAVARVAAAPELFPTGPGQARLALPEGWTAHTVITDADAAVRHLGSGYTVRTADGFANLVKRLAGEREPLVTVDRDGDRDTLHCTCAPSTIDAPVGNSDVVVLNPRISRQLAPWMTAANVSMPAAKFAAFVEDNAATIDAASGPSSIEVAEEATTWNVEARRTVRAQGSGGEADNATTSSVKSGRKLMRSFRIASPIHRGGEPVEMTVVISRDLEKQEMAFTIPGLALLIDADRERIFAEAADLGGVDVIH